MSQTLMVVEINRGPKTCLNAKYGRALYFLTLPLDFLCPRILSTLYHKWIYEYWNSVFKETKLKSIFVLI